MGLSPAIAASSTSPSSSVRCASMYSRTRRTPAGDDEVAAQDSEPNPGERRQLCRGQMIERRHPPDHSPESVGPNPPVLAPDDQQHGRDRERERRPAPNGFALDSPLEGDGFEPSVPHQKDLCKHRNRRRSRRSATGLETMIRGLDPPPNPRGGPRVRIHLPPAASLVRT
jgi:hypothetical protein